MEEDKNIIIFKNQKERLEKLNFEENILNDFELVKKHFEGIEKELRRINRMEELIEELTEVNPSNLSEEGLKLFNKINEIIDKNKELEEMLKSRIKYTNELEKDLFENCSNYVVPKSKIKQIREKEEIMDYYTLPDVIEDLNKLLKEE